MTALTPRQAEWRARAWASYPAVLRLSGRGDAVFRSPTVSGADMGVPHPWGIRICAGDATPDPDDAAAAIAWCTRRDTGHGWYVSAPAARAGDWPGLGRRRQRRVRHRREAAAFPRGGRRHPDHSPVGRRGGVRRMDG
jgi:hypothetical protein